MSAGLLKHTPTPLGGTKMVRHGGYQVSGAKATSKSSEWAWLGPIFPVMQTPDPNPIHTLEHCRGQGNRCLEAMAL